MLTRYTRATCVNFFFIFCLFGSALYFCLRTSSEDKLAYAKLMEENRETCSKSAIEDLPIEQKRKGVRKDLWTKNGHFQFETDHSRLTLIQKKNRWETLEVFDKVEGASSEGHLVTGSSGYADPDSFFLEGDLLLHFELDGKKSVAAADFAYYDPKKEKVILQSLPTKRVLLQQEGLEMSAKEIEIGETIQGVGDVRLYLTKEELCKLY